MRRRRPARTCPPLEEGMKLKVKELGGNQHFTQPPPALHRGLPHQDPGGERHRPALHLRGHHLHHHHPGVRHPGGQGLQAHRAGGGHHQADERTLPQDRQREVHRPGGGRAGRGPAGGRGVGGHPPEVLRRLRQVCPEGQKGDGRGQDQAERGRDRRHLREVRQEDGGQVRPLRQIPGLPRLPRVQKREEDRQRHRGPSAPSAAARSSSASPKRAGCSTAAASTPSATSSPGTRPARRSARSAARP